MKLQNQSATKKPPKQYVQSKRKENIIRKFNSMFKNCWGCYCYNFGVFLFCFVLFCFAEPFSFWINFKFCSCYIFYYVIWNLTHYFPLKSLISKNWANGFSTLFCSLYKKWDPIENGQWLQVTVVWRFSWF